MKLFVGLGNPGAKYAATRHNIGFRAVDAIAGDHGFAPERSKFQGLLAEGRLGAAKVLILKPQTYMNLSGQSVGEAMRFFRLEPDDVTVFHDELDLAPGKVKMKTGGGHAGHNGLRSLHEHIGPDYHRVRIGIGHPGDKRLVSAYVLHDFAKADQEWIDPLLWGIADGAPLLAGGDGPGFLNKVALRMQPPKREPKPSARAEASDGASPQDGASPESGEPPARDEPGDAPAASPLARLAARFAKKRP